MHNYSEFLRVHGDGKIWWLRQDAIRLAAGFAPDCQNHLGLQAPDHEALVNERTLIGALGDAGLPVPLPMMFERDGYHYVDAAGFLEWLSQYISHTQVEFNFPNELANQVQLALAKSAAERTVPRSTEFTSLSFALKGEYEKPLAALSKDLRSRVEQAFLIGWDGLSAMQRESLAEQWDYNNDPATKDEREYWWDFFWRKDALKIQIKNWEATTTPTATDLAQKEAKLEELSNKLRQMEQEEKKLQRSYISGGMQKIPPVAQATFKYIAYPKAMQFLANRLKATPEELAVWIFFGPTQGGLTAYTNANELDPPPIFYFGYHSGVANYIGPLMACWFKEEDIENFQPAERYITGKDLIDRWGHYSGIQPENFILAKIRESRLEDVHPTFGGTKGTFSEKDNFPPLESGLFSMAKIEEIERKDFGVVNDDSMMKKSHGHLNFDPDLQVKANKIAGKFLVEKNRHPTKSEVAKLLAHEVDISIESLLRRIRVKWKKQ